MDQRTKRLRELMTEHFLTPLLVGRLAGVSPRTVSNWKCLSCKDVIPQNRLDRLEEQISKLNLRGTA